MDVYSKDVACPHLGIALCPKLTKADLFLTHFQGWKLTWLHRCAQVYNIHLNHTLSTTNNYNAIGIEFVCCWCPNFLQWWCNFRNTNVHTYVWYVFDYLNATNTKSGIRQRKDSRLPYESPNDPRLKVLKHERSMFIVILKECLLESFLKYLADWKLKWMLNITEA